MPQVFEITTAQNSVRLKEDRTGVASFTVSNISGRNIRGRITITADQPDAQAWLSIAGDVERVFNVGGVDQVDVKIAAPLTAPVGSYTFSISAADTELTDDTRYPSPSVSFELLPVQEKPKPINPLLIIIPIIVVLAIIIVLVIVLSNQGGLTDEERTQTVVAAELTAELTANAARTATAASLCAAQQTANAAATQTAARLTATRVAEIGTQTAVAGSVATITAQAGATATQGALMDAFVGRWDPSPENGTINRINISRTGSVFTVTYNTCQPQNTSSLQCLITPIDRTVSGSAITFDGTTLTATDSFNVLTMTRQGSALRVRFRNSTFFFEPFFIGPIRTLIIIDPPIFLTPIFSPFIVAPTATP
ncbi:MAG: hypothetical protein U0670_18025 [Anaerolineae bacterium]